MALRLYFHPFASFCQKVLIALYENDTPFVPEVVDLGDPVQRAGLAALWPFARFPVLRDEAAGRVVPESTIIIEYLQLHHPGKLELLPADPALALETRQRDRFFDLYVDEPMQKIVTDRIRPAGAHDPHGVARARELLETAYDLIERDLQARTWAVGERFTMADCAAAPALFYAALVLPFGDHRPHTAAYLARLRARPSFARVVEEASPFMKFFPRGPVS